MAEVHRHQQNIPDKLNEAVEEKLEDSLYPTKTSLINHLLTLWCNNKIEDGYGIKKD